MADLYYYESGYIDDNYFVYTADAASALSTAATISATPGFLKEFSISLSDAFSPTVTANVTKNLDVIMDVQAIQVTEPNRLRSIDSALNSEFAVTAEGRVGGTQEASAVLSSSATITIDAVKTVSGVVALDSSFTQSTDVSVFRILDSAMTDQFTLATSVVATVGFGAGLSSDAGIACVNYRVREDVVNAGALFNTAVSATATVNSFAVLDSVSSISVDAERFANVSATLSSESTVTAQGETSKNVEAALSSEFTQTAAADKLKQVSSNISSAATVSVDVTAYKGLIETLSAAFTQTTVADAILLFRDAGYIEFTPQPDIDLSSTQHKFGAKSLSMANTTSNATVRGTLRTSAGSDQIYNFSDNSWTIEFWFRDNIDLTTSDTSRRVFALLDTSNVVRLALYVNGLASTSNQYVFDGDFTSTPDSVNLTVQDFKHWAIVKDGSAIRIYADGTRITNSTWTASFTNVRKLFLGEYIANNLVEPGYFDELRISDSAIYTGTSITVPTDEFARSRKNIAHYKFEDYVAGYSNRTPSEQTLESGTAALSSQFTQTVNAAKVVLASADLVATGGQLTVAEKSVEASANLSAAFTQTVSGLRIKNSAVNEMDAHTEISVAPTKIVQATGNGNFTATAELSLIITHYKGIQCVANSEFTQSTVAYKTVDAVSTPSSQFTQTVSGDRLRSTTSAQSASFTQSTTVRRIAGLLSAQSSTATVSAVIGSIQPATITLPSVATTVIATAVNATGTILLESSFTQSTTATRVFELTSISDPIGVTFKDSSSFTSGDVGPFLSNPAVGAQTNIGRILISFYASRYAQGTVLDFSHDGANDKNRIKLRNENSEWFFDYYGNDAASEVYPVVSFRLGYDSNLGYQHYLFYMDLPSYTDSFANINGMYKLLLNGQPQELAQVDRTYSTLSYKHPLDIEQMSMGISISSDIPASTTQYGFDLTDSVNNDPSVTQVWIDAGIYDVTDPTLVNKFYPGKYIDLGVNGTDTGLSRPDYYFRLRDYTDIAQGGTATIDSDTLNWYFLDNKRLISGQYYWTPTVFSATTEQNSAAQYRTIAATFDVDATLTGVTAAAAALSSSATVTATVGYLSDGAATLSSAASMTVAGGRVTGYTSAINSAFTQSVDATKLFGIIQTLSSETALSATARLAITHQGAASLTVTASTVTVANNFVGINAQLTSSATVLCEARIPVLGEAQALLSSTATLSADANVIPPIRTSADLTAAATITCVAVKNYGGDIQMDANFGISFQLDRLRTTSGTANSAATLTVDGGRPRYFEANLPSIFSEVVVGTNIHVDLFYQIKVEPESRTGNILPESRLITVEQETRLNMIL